MAESYALTYSLITIFILQLQVGARVGAIPVFSRSHIALVDERRFVHLVPFLRLHRYLTIDWHDCRLSRLIISSLTLYRVNISMFVAGLQRNTNLALV